MIRLKGNWLQRSPMPFGSQGFSPAGVAALVSTPARSPMPFGSQGFSPSARRGRTTRRKRSVTNAFRQSGLFALVQPGTGQVVVGGVTNAFRQSGLFAQHSTHHPLNCVFSHQCLSAVRAFRPFEQLAQLAADVPGVTNAFRQSGHFARGMTRAGWPSLARSPMPFGSQGISPLITQTEAALEHLVTNAFRQSGHFAPRILCPMSNLLGLCHQCLSAVRALRPW